MPTKIAGRRDSGKEGTSWEIKKDPCSISKLQVEGLLRSV
jgi:hypothetical protein